MFWTSSLVEYLDTAARKSAAYSERHFFLFGCLAWFIPLATAIDYLVGEPFYDTLFIRLSVSVLALPLVIVKRLPGYLADRFYLYFTFLIGYAFPFCYGHMLEIGRAHV